MALPIEMIDEILCRLSVKHLLRCRCVSKEWCSFIDSTAFAKKHLKYSRDNNAGFGLMIMKVGGDPKFYFLSLDSLDDDSAALVKIKDPLKTFLCGAEILGASNGLMCVLLHNDGEDIFLLNPATRKYKMIAPTPPEFPSSFGIYDMAKRYICGFGYDEVNDDYKVLMTAKFRGLIAMVYSFKTNSWTRIQNVPSNIHFTGTRGIFASGSLHWMASKNQSNSKDIIVGFDLELQQFKEVPFPPTEVTDDSSKSRFLVDVGKYLCILDRTNFRMDVWLMNYPGAGSTWYKALSTEQEEILGTHTSIKPIAFSRCGEDLLLQVSNYYTKLAWYNLDRETVTDVGIYGFPIQFCSFLYTESLLQLTEDEPLQQKTTEDKQKKKTNKRGRDEFLSGGSSLRL